MDIRVENENWNHLGKNVCQEFQVQRIAPARLKCHETAQQFYCSEFRIIWTRSGGGRKITVGAKMGRHSENREAYVAVTNTPNLTNLKL